MFWYSVKENVVDFLTNDIAKSTPIIAVETTIQKILQSYVPPYYLMVSGGIDSQAMLYGWKLFGKDYIPTTVIYNQAFNLHDIKTIKSFANNYNIEINYIDFDLLNFLHSEYDTFSEQYRCSSPCIGAYIKMTEGLKGTVVFSGDFLSNCSARLTDAILGLYRASLQRKNIIPYFFLHSPEIAYSFLYTEKNLDFYKLNDYQKKVFMYQHNLFPVIPQETKISGFELVKDYYDEHYYNLVPPLKRIKYNHKPSKRTFDLLYRYPYEEKYQDKDLKFILNPL